MNRKVKRLATYGLGKNPMQNVTKTLDKLIGCDATVINRQVCLVGKLEKWDCTGAFFVYKPANDDHYAFRSVDVMSVRLTYQEYTCFPMVMIVLKNHKLV